MRDASSPRAAFLSQLPHASDRLVVYSADLLNEGAFDAPFEGVSAVIHTAAAVKLTAKGGWWQISALSVCYVG